MQDTVNSLITDALHGKTYVSNQSDLISAFILLSIVMGIVVIAWTWATRTGHHCLADAVPADPSDARVSGSDR